MITVWILATLRDPSGARLTISRATFYAGTSADGIGVVPSGAALTSSIAELTLISAARDDAFGNGNEVRVQPDRELMQGVADQKHW